MDFGGNDAGVEHVAVQPHPSNVDSRLHPAVLTKSNRRASLAEIPAVFGSSGVLCFLGLPSEALSHCTVWVYAWFAYQQICLAVLRLEVKLWTWFWAFLGCMPLTSKKYKSPFYSIYLAYLPLNQVARQPSAFRVSSGRSAIKGVIFVCLLFFYLIWVLTSRNLIDLKKSESKGLFFLTCPVLKAFIQLKVGCLSILPASGQQFMGSSTCCNCSHRVIFKVGCVCMC